MHSRDAVSNPSTLISMAKPTHLVNNMLIKYSCVYNFLLQNGSHLFFYIYVLPLFRLLQVKFELGWPCTFETDYFNPGELPGLFRL